MLPEVVQRLQQELGRLPGIGPRSAERLALHIVQAERNQVSELAEALLAARERIQFCERCGALTEVQPCRICGDVGRETTLLCVVEQPVDVLSIEKSGTFRGRFHVLGGKIAPLDGIGPEDLRISQLEQRLTKGKVEEVVIALGTDVEGDATSRYLSRLLTREGLRVTRIAHGLPAGTGLEFADQLTLARALEGRREI